MKELLVAYHAKEVVSVEPQPRSRWPSGCTSYAGEKRAIREALKHFRLTDYGSN